MRTTQGLTLGVYLYTYAFTFETAFGGSEAPDAALLLGAVFTFGILVEAFLELPLGAYGGIRGYRPTLAQSFLYRGLYFVGLLVLSLGILERTSAIILAFITIAAFSISYTLWSGSSSAWFYKAVRLSGAEARYSRLFSLTQTSYWLSFIISAIAASQLHFNGLIWTAYATGAIVSFGSSIFVWLQLIDSQPSAGRYRTSGETHHIADRRRQFYRQLVVVLSDAFRYCLESKSIFRALQLDAFFSTLMWAVDYLWPLYAQKTKGMTTFDGKWVLLVAVMAGGAVIGTRIISLLNRDFVDQTKTLWSLFITASWLLGGAMLVLSQLEHFVGTAFSVFVTLMMAGKIAVGLRDVSHDAPVNRLITTASAERTQSSADDVRATILSAGFILNGLVVLFFFVPTTIMNLNPSVPVTENISIPFFLSAGWTLADILLIAITIWTQMAIHLTQDTPTYSMWANGGFSPRFDGFRGPVWQ